MASHLLAERILGRVQRREPRPGLGRLVDRLRERLRAAAALREPVADLGGERARFERDPAYGGDVGARVAGEAVDRDDRVVAELADRGEVAAQVLGARLEVAAAVLAQRLDGRRRRPRRTGWSPPSGATMCANFSKPMSAPKPLSVTTKSPSLSASRSATSELFPCAMLAKGPQWTSTGWPSSVWIRFGLIASFSRTAIEPAAPSCSAVTRSWSRVCATVIAPSRSRRSARSRATASTAMTSEAAVMSKPVSRGQPVGAAAERDHDVAQRAVVRVEAAAEGDRERVDAERVAVQQVRVDHRGEQVVGGRDGVHVAGEVEVQVLHRHDLRAAGACAAALDPEHRAHRGLAQAEHGALAQQAESLGQRDRGRRLALACLRRRDRGDADQRAVRDVRAALDGLQSDLGLVAAVQLDLVVGEPELCGHLGDRAGLRLLRDAEALCVGVDRRRHAVSVVRSRYGGIRAAADTACGIPTPCSASGPIRLASPCATLEPEPTTRRRLQ